MMSLLVCQFRLLEVNNSYRQGLARKNFSVCPTSVGFKGEHLCLLRLWEGMLTEMSQNNLAGWHIRRL